VKNPRRKCPAGVALAFVAYFFSKSAKALEERKPPPRLIYFIYLFSSSTSNGIEVQAMT